MTNNKQQTAVEWLCEKLSKYDEEMVFLYTQEIKQAKEMEKEEIKIAYYNGTTDEIKTKDELLLDAEHYYNETYGGGEQ